ncbi:hypothetical protein JCM13591A_38850 [Microbacterium xylanilyticum]
MSPLATPSRDASIAAPTVPNMPSIITTTTPAKTAPKICAPLTPDPEAAAERAYAASAARSTGSVNGLASNGYERAGWFTGVVTVPRYCGIRDCTAEIAGITPCGR